MRPRSKSFDIDTFQGLLTPEEKELHVCISYLCRLNDALETIGLDIDSSDKQEIESIIASQPESKEFCDALLRTSEEVAKTLNNIKELLERKPNNIDINKQDTEVEVSVLHIVAGIGSFKLVDLFFQHGADPNLENCFGQTPAERARDYARRFDIAAYINHLHAAYDRSLALSRTGMFRHAYREEFTIESDYQPNQEPLKLR